MKCVSCGATLADNVKFCTICGTPVKKEEPAAPVVEAPPVVPPVTRPVTPPPVQPVVVMPPQPKLMGPWAYFGLSLLFNIPVVGFVFLIVFSCSRANINRRNFARSYWCIYVLLAIVLFIMAIAGGSFAYEFARF